MFVGQGTPKNAININKMGLDSMLAQLAAGTVPTTLVEPLLLTPTERALFDDPIERTAIVDGVANKVATLFNSVSAGIEVRDNAIGNGAVFVAWGTDADRGFFGTSRLGAGVDNGQEIYDIQRDRNRWSEAERAFRLANALNKKKISIVEVFVDNHLEYASSGDGGTPTSLRQPLNLTTEQLINVLALTVAHEVAHTLGLVHSAQGDLVPTQAGEQQRITLLGGTRTVNSDLNLKGALLGNSGVMWVEWGLRQRYRTYPILAESRKT